MDLFTPIEKIPRIGDAYQKKLKKLGIKTVKDIIFHFPHRYEDFSNIIPISKIQLNQNCCIQGKILEIGNTKTWKKRMFLTQAVVEDKTAAIKIVWFNQPYLTKILKSGDLVCLTGKTTFGDKGVYLTNPAYEKIPSNLTHTGRIIPVYPETQGLSSKWFRFIVKPLLAEFKNKIPDTIPEKIKRENQFLPFNKAIWQIHFPDSLEMAKKAQERFSFEEIFYLSLFIFRERAKLAREKAVSVPIDLKTIQKFVKSLPFQLTDSQKKCSWRILKDLEKPRPMNRLLEGDVGSGKTVVATIAALNAVRAGYQVALMAPTEILAKQHFKTVSDLLNQGLYNSLWGGINLGILTGKEDKIISKKLKNDTIEVSRKKILEKALKGEIDILIGTHALISAGGKKKKRRKSSFFRSKKIQETEGGVKFKKLALVILDEQHRFGVEQRARLCKIHDTIPHLLSMTATPIPRTLALTIYGDLDLSLIDELPKGRKEIITKIIPTGERNKTYKFIKKEAKKGRQIFIICPRIEPGEKNISEEKNGFGWSETKTVKEEYERLSKEVFPELKLAMIHGKIAPKEKEKIMKDFRNKKANILVSTSVIEVGIDIPNASVIVIEGAERFGLAQLHQFRGRVGRSKYQSYCFLFTDSFTKKTQQRLKALISSKSGFELSEKDLEIRGPGDLTGQRQWGIPDLAMNALKNISLVEKTREAAKKILEEDSGLKKYPTLLEKLKKYREEIHLE